MWVRGEAPRILPPQRRKARDMPQTKFILKCSQCGEQNYVTSKNRQNVAERLTLSKYCPACRAHTKHEETRLRR
jgi:large subunit ribosomal protein L33